MCYHLKLHLTWYKFHIDYLLVEKKDAFAEEQTQEKRGFLKKKKVFN